VDVTDKVLWERLAYGPEGVGDGRFRWTRPSGELLVPIPGADAAALPAPAKITFRVLAERDKPLEVAGPGAWVTATVGPSPHEVVVPVAEGTALVDVVNNAGGIVLVEGYGADRGFQEVDRGQYDEPVEVFTACGNGVAMRTEVGRELGWFDDDFFLYYEDTDLSWRLRARGWAIRYEPTAVLRHIHSATSTEWSPLWTFHVDRNRLLMLTKDATAGLAVRAALRYPLTSASMLVRAGREAARSRSRPALRPHLLRLRVLASYLRLLPRMLHRRVQIGRTAAVDRQDLERWLVAQR
jgi:Glycosyltransferase like family 2